MKTCTKCKELKNFTSFGKSKSIKDGYKSSCKLCLSLDNKLYYSNNKEKESLRKKKQYERDSEKIIEQQLSYYNENKEYRSEWVKNKRKEQPEVFRKYGKTYREDHKDNINSYYKNRRKTDIQFRLKTTLRNRLLESIKYKSWNKSSKFSEYIGCTLNQLKDHLESQFKEGMTWENHSRTGWHIDHIIPLDSAKTEEELYKLCHYTNLQPMWALDNLKKSNKMK